VLVLLAPRWLLFHALALVAMALCLAGANWQWDRAHRTASEALGTAAPVPLSATGVDPGTVVRVEGSWDRNHQLWVPARRDGMPGAWVVSLLKSTEGDAVVVVRGFLPEGQASGVQSVQARSVEAASAQGQESPSASSQPSEAGKDDVGIPELSDGMVAVIGPFLPDEHGLGEVKGRTLSRIDTVAIAESVGYPVRTGWVALQSVDPPMDSAVMPLEVSELPGAQVGLSWRNAAYALQWVVFAAIAFFFWFRFVRDATRGASEEVVGGYL
jgi:cytochrome oxidase assembly protein ShyY1